VPYLSASAVVIHYEEVLYQVSAPLPFTTTTTTTTSMTVTAAFTNYDYDYDYYNDYYY